MLRYKLSTLLIVLALVPPILGALAYGYLSTQPVAFMPGTWQARVAQVASNLGLEEASAYRLSATSPLTTPTPLACARLPHC